MNKSPESTAGLEEKGPAPITYAQWKFIQYVAKFYHQAEKEGNLEMYFSSVTKLYSDRWPEEGSEVALEEVRQFGFLERFLYLNRYVYSCALRSLPQLLALLVPFHPGIGNMFFASTTTRLIG